MAYAPASADPRVARQAMCASRSSTITSPSGSASRPRSWTPATTSCVAAAERGRAHRRAGRPRGGCRGARPVARRWLYGDRQREARAGDRIGRARALDRRSGGQCPRGSRRRSRRRHPEVVRRPASVLTAAETVARGEVLNNLEWATAIDADRDFAKAQLGRREREILHLYASGLPLKLAAQQLGIGYSTAREYLDRIRVKYVEVGRPGADQGRPAAPCGRRRDPSGAGPRWRRCPLTSRPGWLPRSAPATRSAGAKSRPSSPARSRCSASCSPRRPSRTSSASSTRPSRGGCGRSSPASSAAWCWPPSCSFLRRFGTAGARDRRRSSTCVALASWPFTILPGADVFTGIHWLYYLLTVATACAAVRVQHPVRHALPADRCRGSTSSGRILPNGGDAHRGSSRCLETVYSIILGGAVMIIVTPRCGRPPATSTSRRRRRSTATRTPCASTPSKVERVQVDSIVHDSVLTTLLSAARAETPEAKALAARMATSAIGHLREAIAVGPVEASTVRVSAVAQRIRDEVEQLAARSRCVPIAWAPHPSPRPPPRRCSPPRCRPP